MIHHFFTKQFLGFVAVGGIAAFLHWLSRIILGYWMSFSSAVILAYAIGMAVAFSLNKLYVFPKSQRSSYKQARDFILINLAFLPVVWGVAMFLEPRFRALGFSSYSQAAAHGIAIILPIFITFLAYKFFAFKELQHGRK